MDEKNLDGLSPEEAKAEQEALEEKKEDEIRAEIITEFGFDEEDDADRIEKAVARELKHRKITSQAIGQKIKYREEAAKLKTQPPKEEIADENKGKLPEFNPEDFEKKTTEIVRAQFEERELESLEYPDELKESIKKIAKINSVSVKKAVQDPYIKFQIDEYEKNQKTEEATIGKTANKSGGKQSYSLDNIPDFDMSTEDGRKKYDAHMEELKKKGF